MILFKNIFILLILLVTSLTSYSDDNIEEKIKCAADIITLQKLFKDEDNPNIPSQERRISHWNIAIKNKLISLGKSELDANKIINDAVNKSYNNLASIFNDRSVTETKQKEQFDNWWTETTGCIKKYSKQPNQH